MTTYNKATLKTFFAQNDIPEGTDYANFIDSYINIVDTAAQSMAGSLTATKLIAPQVSATTANITGAFTGKSIGLIGDVSAATVFASAAQFTGDVSASTGTVYASAMRSTNGIFAGTGIVSAAGVAQGTAAILTNVINRGQGVVDTTTTGFAIPANKIGLTQYLLVEGATSANLWPPTGGKINNGSANTVFALAGNTSYTIFHVAASAYGVK